MPGAETVKDCLDPLNAFLLREHAAGRNNVLIIDEAQSLAPEVLEQLRLLTNLETSERKLLQIVLIGQPELRAMVADPALEQLAQRVIARYHLDALTPGETRQYIAHRMAVAGLKGPLPFTARALVRIHQRARGIPRRINLLCDRALLGAYAGGLHAVDDAIVERAAAEVFGPGAAGLAPTARRPRWVAAGAGALAGAAAIAAAGWGLGWVPASRPAPWTIGGARPRGRGGGGGSGAGAGHGRIGRQRRGGAPARAFGPAGFPGRAAVRRGRRVARAGGRLGREGRAGRRRRLRRPAAPGPALLPAAARQPGPGAPAGPARLADPLSLRGCAGLRAAGGLRSRAADGAAGRGRRPAPGRDRGGPRPGLARRIRDPVARPRGVARWRAYGVRPSPGPGLAGCPARACRRGRSPAAGQPAATAATAGQRRARIYRFQVAQGLVPDGVAGPLTLMLLNRAAGVDEPRLPTS